jgi:hypothetical protein
VQEEIFCPLEGECERRHPHSRTRADSGIALTASVSRLLKRVLFRKRPPLVPAGSQRRRHTIARPVPSGRRAGSVQR